MSYTRIRTGRGTFGERTFRDGLGNDMSQELVTRETDDGEVTKTVEEWAEIDRND